MSAVAEKPSTAVEAPAHAGAAPMGTADANRLLYADHAAHYDSSEHCIHQEGPRRLLEELLERAVAAIDTPSSRELRILDACGGTGNVSELLARRGMGTTLVDVSPQMIARWRAKAGRIGVTAETLEAEIDSFLLSDGRSWDMIAFSSALHHLDDPTAVCELAASRLAPGGVLVTAFDPIQTDDPISQRLRRLDYLLSLIARPSAFVAAAGRKLRRRNEGGINVGDLAEKHALVGVDDERIVDVLTTAGLEIVEHERYACQRFRLTEWIIRASGRSTTFHLIARGSGSASTPTVSE